MALVSEWIRYGSHGQFTGYLARPEKANGALPAVIVIQEIWGVDEHIEDVTRRFAQAGYVALSPDLYAKDGTRPEALSADRISQVKQFLESVPPTVWNNTADRDAALEAQPEPQRTQIKTTFGTLFAGNTPDKYRDSMLATVDYLSSACEYTKGQKIGSVGFCMGGMLSGWLSTEAQNLNAAVIFYGNRPAEEAIPNIACPVMGFYGSLDPRISDAVPGLAADMEAKGKAFSYQIYEGAHHAFFNDTRASYHPAAARDAFARTLAFFNEQLS